MLKGGYPYGSFSPYTDGLGRLVGIGLVDEELQKKELASSFAEPTVNA